MHSVKPRDRNRKPRESGKKRNQILNGNNFSASYVGKWKVWHCEWPFNNVQLKLLDARRGRFNVYKEIHQQKCQISRAEQKAQLVDVSRKYRMHLRIEMENCKHLNQQILVKVHAKCINSGQKRYKMRVAKWCIFTLCQFQHFKWQWQWYFN